jgi:hypothetical protein
MHTRDTSTEGSDTLATPVLLVTIATNSRKARVDHIATNSRKASVGCLATNIRKARFSIGQSKCYIKKETEKLVSLRQLVSTMLAVNYRRRKPVFKRVSVVSGVRSLSPYLV